MTGEILQDTIIIQGSGEMASVVENIDFSTMLREFRYEIAEEKDAAFTNQATPGGDPWAPLAESTKKTKGFSTILVDTGALRTSLVDVDGPGNVNEVTSHGLIYGTDVEYARFHETGTTRIPARPIIGLGQETVDKLADNVADMTAESVAESAVELVSKAAEPVESQRNPFSRGAQLLRKFFT